MMRISNTNLDLLTLDIAKQHLNILHDNDNSIIQTYIDASADVVSNYIHEPILTEIWISETWEFMAYENGSFNFYLPHHPKTVSVDIAGTVTELRSIDYGYDFARNILTIPYDPNINGTAPDSVTALVGKVSDLSAIQQARLLLIGSFYSFRSNDSDLRVTEIPFGAKTILDNLTGSSL